MVLRLILEMREDGKKRFFYTPEADLVNEEFTVKRATLELRRASCMGQDGEGNSAWSSAYSVGDLVASRRSMASGHSRSSSCDSSASSSSGYIEHPVSRFDTLAGMAIKYGVEVGDIKRMNGLVTDLQVFALKTIKIPLPGRHLLTQSQNNTSFSGKARQLRKPTNPDLAQVLKEHATKEHIKRPVTSAMGLLRGYYGLGATPAIQGAEGTEMSVYKTDSDYHSEEEPFSPLRAHEMVNVRYLNNGSLDSRRDFWNACEHHSEEHHGVGKAKASASFEPFPKPSRGTGLKLEPSGESGVLSEIERTNDRLFRRRAKGEFTGQAPDIPLEMSTAAGVEANDLIVPVSLGKSSALRQKIPPPLDQDSVSLSWSGVNSSLSGWHTSSDRSGLAGTAVRAFSTSVEGFISKIRRSSSNSALHEERRSYKDKEDSPGTPMVSQGSVQSAVISTVLEGFPKAGAMRRNKAALD